ncbi:DUF2076 domain-containing protein [Amorphus sp. MBR-141]
MTPTERDLLDRLFDRIDAASDGPRDGEAEALIRQRVTANPGAPYRMAQTIAVQDEALKRAEERIRLLEGTETAQGPSARSGFQPGGLAGEAAAASGRRSSVPSAGARPAGFGGGGFLAGAGQVALGIVGGSLLMEGIRGLMGDDGAAQAATTDPTATDPAADPASDAGADQADASGGAASDSGDSGGWDSAGMDGGDGGGSFLDGLFDEW